MPRQDVPYGGAICRLRERIAEIFDKLGEKLHTINGVEGDGQGNVQIVSGDAAITISESQPGHYVEIGLDHGELPAAAVSSVNGQTGAVALDAGDIPTVGGDVQSDIQDLANDISGNTAAINAEVLARQGADSTLQTNINNITASLPSQVVAAVAADPTIALLVSADNDNVKLTGNQSISGVKTVPTQATGSYDQQIANSQKVKNELDNYAPMIRTANNQKKSGVLWVNDLNSTSVKNSGADAYFIFARLNSNAVTTTRFSFILSSRGPFESGYYYIWAMSATTMQVVTAATQPASFKIVTDGTYQYFAALVQNNNIKRITFLDQMDAFDRQLPDMTLFAPYAVTTETDVMVSQ